MNSFREQIIEASRWVGFYNCGAVDKETVQICISPLVGDGVKALDVLLHEMIHAALPNDAGHGPLFVKACKAIGMTKGKPTCASAGEDLLEELGDIIKHMGTDYPHVKTVVKPKDDKRAKSGGTILIYCSQSDERFRVQIGERALEAYGPPICPIDGKEMVLSKGRPPRWD